MLDCLLFESRKLMNSEEVNQLYRKGFLKEAILVAELPELGRIGSKPIASLVSVATHNRDSGPCEDVE